MDDDLKSCPFALLGTGATPCVRQGRSDPEMRLNGKGNVCSLPVGAVREQKTGDVQELAVIEQFCCPSTVRKSVVNGKRKEEFANTTWTFSTHSGI